MPPFHTRSLNPGFPISTRWNLSLVLRWGFVDTKKGMQLLAVGSALASIFAFQVYLGDGYGYVNGQEPLLPLQEYGISPVWC